MAGARAARAARRRLARPAAIRRKLAEAVADADIVQESTPERIDGKIRVFAEMDAADASTTLLASSTSGLPMTRCRPNARHPERTVVGHPFHPPYLIPLVEVVGGERTSPEAVDRLAAFYSAHGKEVVRLRREVPGFIATPAPGGAVARDAAHGRRR